MSSLSISSITSTTPIQLIYVPEESVVVKFPQGYAGQASFSKDYEHLASSMKLVGIPIPSNERANYQLREGRRNIYLSDPDFGKAFYEIHFKEKMNPEKFQWRAL